MCYTVNMDGISASNKPHLTRRECEVLKWLCEGHTTYQIADVMCISDRTVNYHLHNIFIKLGVHTRVAAMRMVFDSKYELLKPKRKQRFAPLANKVTCDV